MAYTASRKLNISGGGPKGLPSSVRKIAGLIAGFFLVWLFMFVLAPWIEKSPAVKPLAQFIEETGIDASALYYTDVEEASEAELNMRHTMKYMPVDIKGDRIAAE